jgi:hypothetical protein
MTTVTAQPTRGQPSGLVVGGVETAQAIDPTLGGLQVDNQLTGTGFERVLTTSDVGAGVGDVVGPGSSVDDRLVTWDGVTGKLIQDNTTITAGGVAGAGTIRGALGLRLESLNGGALVLGTNTTRFEDSILVDHVRGGPAGGGFRARNDNVGIVFGINALDNNGIIFQTGSAGGDEGTFVDFIRNGAVILYEDDVQTARTADLATGGFEVNNTVTGTGFERVLTTSDLGAPAAPDNAVQFNNAGAFGGSANFTWDDQQLFIKNTASGVPVLQINMQSTNMQGLRFFSDQPITTAEYTPIIFGDSFGGDVFNVVYNQTANALRFENQTGAPFAEFNQDTIALGGSYRDPNNAPFTIGESGYGQAGIGDVAISTTLFMEGLPFNIGLIPATAGRFWVKSDTPPTPWFTTDAGGDNQLAYVADVVPNTRLLTAGAGMTGGGDLSADRTFDVVANADGSIVVNADDVQVGVLATDAQHGTRGGGTLHAEATTLVAGFMSAADKTKLDGITPTVFGTEFESDFEATEQSTTSPVYVTPYSYTTASLPAGDYMVQWTFDAGEESDKEASHRVTIDGTEVSNAEWRIKEGIENDGTAWFPFSGQHVLTLGAGTHTIAFQYRTNDTAYIRNKQVSIYRVA